MPIKVRSRGKEYEYVRVSLPPEIYEKAVEICREAGIRFNFPSQCVSYIINRYYELLKLDRVGNA